MSKLFIPEGYTPALDVYDTQKAISFIKQTFQSRLASALHLKRVTAPLFVAENSGLNDNLSGKERPVSFDIPAIGLDAQVVHSLAKWKRLALKRYNFGVGDGLYTDMNAIRRDEWLDNVHSIYVDQWDWEKIITRETRNMDYLKLSSGAIKDTETDPIYHQIIMQQYIAMFNQAIDAWTLLRRSQVLDLPPHYQPETGYGAVNAGNADVQFSYIPQRFAYPSSEVQDNQVEVEKAINEYLVGGDNLDTKLWWAKEQLINPRLQQLVDNYKN